MLALVLSGGANFGAMQAGALEILFETGFRPEIIIGTSAGALNAIYITHDPTPEGARRLATLWTTIEPRMLGTHRLLLAKGILRTITHQDGLLPSAPLAKFLRRYFPPEVETFGQLATRNGIRTFVTALCIETGGLYVFGDRDDDLLIDGAMASTAIPPYLAPWGVGEHRYLDGGIYTKLPLTAAIQRGATQIVGLNIIEPAQPRSPRGVVAISAYSISLMIEHQVAREIKQARAIGIPLRVIDLPTPSGVSFWDYRHASYLARFGREAARKALEETPLKIYPAWQRWIYRTIAKARGAI